MTNREYATWKKYHDLWMTGRATKAQILRCMDLEHKRGAEVKIEAISLAEEESRRLDALALAYAFEADGLI